MNPLCDLGVSAVKHLAGLRWNLARLPRPARWMAPRSFGVAGRAEFTDVHSLDLAANRKPPATGFLDATRSVKEPYRRFFLLRELT